MKIPFLDLQRQYDSIKSEIDESIRHVITDCAFVGGPYVEAFEAEFATFCHAKHCVGVGNGTDALTLVLRSNGRSDRVTK